MKLSKIDKVSMWKFYNKMFRGSWENDKFLKILLHIYLKNLQIHFNPSQNIFLISLLDSMVILTSEKSISCKYFK